VRIWFYLGDSFEWLESYKRVSGVTRVTLELFFAASSQIEYSEYVVPCILARSAGKLVGELASVRLADALAYFALKTGKAISSKGPVVPSGRSTSPPELRLSPKPGDHILFTGVVWTAQYFELFRRLSASDIEFSVLVHDIIPIERPDLVTGEQNRVFVEWLNTVIEKASIIFVSSQTTKDQILRWAALMGLDVVARIVPIVFGSSKLASILAAHELAGGATTSRVDLHSFVLSVGTIDRRKNQAVLCKVWCRLVSQLGEDLVPQLVLAGRNDLESNNLAAETLKALNESKIVILENLSDAELSGLYRACLFTVFPSFSEGYGLPVAESLQHGKLCLASNLATIKEHAGDLAWYFNPTAEETIYGIIRRAIERTDLRAEGEQQILRFYTPRSWTSTFQSIAVAINANRCEHFGRASLRIDGDALS
jgi:glycosyltransferase involved in cell wall biosynthesis